MLCVPAASVDVVIDAYPPTTFAVPTMPKLMLSKKVTVPVAELAPAPGEIGSILAVRVTDSPKFDESVVADISTVDRFAEPF